MGNGETIEAAAKLIRERAPSNDRPRVWAPQDWREVDVEYPTGQLVVRMTPVDGGSVNVEVFSYGALIGGECLRKCKSAESLAEQAEDVLKRAVERT